MKSLVMVAISVALSSCQPNSTSASGPDARTGSSSGDAAQKSTRDDTTVVLDVEEQQKGHIVVASVGLGDVAATLTIPGRLTFNEDETWRVGAIASGRIENISARVGDSVQSGQILGRLHEQGGSRHLCQLRAKAGDDLIRGGVAVIAGLQADYHESIVEGPGPAESGAVGRNPRIALDHVMAQL